MLCVCVYVRCVCCHHHRHALDDDEDGEADAWWLAGDYYYSSGWANTDIVYEPATSDPYEQNLT